MLKHTLHLRPRYAVGRPPTTGAAVELRYREPASAVAQRNMKRACGGRLQTAAQLLRIFVRRDLRTSAHRTMTTSIAALLVIAVSVGLPAPADLLARQISLGAKPSMNVTAWPVTARKDTATDPTPYC